MHGKDALFGASPLTIFEGQLEADWFPPGQHFSSQALLHLGNCEHVVHSAMSLLDKSKSSHRSTWTSPLGQPPLLPCVTLVQSCLYKNACTSLQQGVGPAFSAWLDCTCRSCAGWFSNAARTRASPPRQQWPSWLVSSWSWTRLRPPGRLLCSSGRPQRVPGLSESAQLSCHPQLWGTGGCWRACWPPLAHSLLDEGGLGMDVPLAMPQAPRQQAEVVSQGNGRQASRGGCQHFTSQGVPGCTQTSGMQVIAVLGVGRCWSSGCH